MKKKLFCVSDVHSYFTPLKKALDAVGFEVGNENHLLIVCGDAFDRGNESREVLRFLMTTPNKILIRGNHEDLLEELCLRGYPHQHDHSNGTKKTVDDLGGSGTFDERCEKVYNKLACYRSSLVNYFETKNYIFVHGWIPCEKWVDNPKNPWYQLGKTWEYDPDWRKCNAWGWESARWTNGIARAFEGVIEPGKTIVCGHWHCSYGHHLKSIKTDKWISEFEEDANWEPFEAEGIIAIDRCTAHTGKVNVVVLEDELLD